jgi:hypothetical protein
LPIVAFLNGRAYFRDMEATVIKVFPIFRKNDLLLPVGTLEWITETDWCITIKSGLPAPINTSAMEPVYMEGEIDHWLCD